MLLKSDDERCSNNIVAFCALVSLLIINNGSLGHFESYSVPSLAKNKPASNFGTTKIENIRLGQRVVADDARGEHDDAFGYDSFGGAYTPSDWREVRLRSLAISSDVFEVRFLRPVRWLQAENAEVGATIQLNLPELGLVGPAWVTDVLPCPAIDPGPGRVVTGTFKRTARELLEVKFAGDSDGSAEVETLTTTPEHPFYSVEHEEYIPAGKLREGEHVATQHGNRKIIGLLPRPGPVLVYNLEVNYAHNYHVGSSGVLVHNAYHPNSSRYRGGSHRDMTARARRGDGLDSHHIPHRNADPSVHVNDGPAIHMAPGDHANTSSWGSSNAANQYRDDISELIRQGRIRDAFAIEIRDVRRVARAASDPRRYNQAIQEMLNYARQTGQLPRQ